MMFKLSVMQKERIYNLYQKVNDPLIGSGDLDIECFIEFAKIRSSIRALNPSFNSEFEILKLMGKRMAGMPVMHTPRVFIDFDFKPLTTADISSKFEELKEFFGKEIEMDPKPALNKLFVDLDAIIPCKTRVDLEFGLEALYCIAAVNDGKNKSTWFEGPAN